MKRAKDWWKKVWEKPDPTPIEVPAGMKKPESLQQMIQRLIRTDVSKFAVDHGAESFEDANDFDIEDDDAESTATHHELLEEVVDETKRHKREQAAEAAKRRRSVRGSETEGGEDEVQTSSARSTAGDRLQRKRVTDPDSPEPRSPQRRSTERREDAEIDHRRGRTGRVELNDDDA